MEDFGLLREYSEKGSEKAFATLVNRHLSLVYSAALRRLGDPEAAEDITQSVFCLLARKAGKLGPKTVLAGWLHRAVCLATAKYWRTEYRRRRHEQEAAAMISDPHTPDATWEELAPHLDEALNRLDEDDRHAVLLRFFQGKPFQEVGQALCITEDAARMRVNRSVERIRLFLQRERIVCTTAALGTLLASRSIEAAPATLAGTVGTNALRMAGAASGASFLSVFLGLAARHKIQTAVGVGVVALTGVIGLQLVRSSNDEMLAQKESIAPPKATISANVSARTEAFRPAATESTPIRAEPPAPLGIEDPPSLSARELYERGLVHEREKRHDEALADLTKSVELLDQDIGRWEWFTDVYFTRASLFAEKKDHASAISDYTKMLEFQPKRYSPRFNRALYYSRLGQIDAAIADYSAILGDPDTDFSSNLEPKEKLLARTYEYRGRIFQDRKDYREAIADYTDALRLDPSGGDNMIVYWRRGLSYRASKQIDKANEDANQLSQWALQWATNPSSPESDRDNAFSAARFGSEILNHKQPYQLEVLAATRARTGDFEQAVKYQKDAIKLSDPASDQRAAMEARLKLYETRKPLIKE